jgi:prolyl 4-hydroxylase
MSEQKSLRKVDKYYSDEMMGYTQPPLETWRMDNLILPENSPSVIMLDSKNGSFELYDILSKEESQHIIAETEKLGFDICFGYDPSYRSNTRVIVSDPDFTDRVWERIKNYVPNEIAAHGSVWKACGLNELLRICRYTQGQHFDPHCDSVYTKNKNERSFLTINLYLNDGFEGGNTRILKARGIQGKENILFETKPKSGMGLIFRQEYILHDGEAVKSGVKYLLRSDIMYRKE